MAVQYCTPQWWGAASWQVCMPHHCACQCHVSLLLYHPINHTCVLFAGWSSLQFLCASSSTWRGCRRRALRPRARLTWRDTWSSTAAISELGLFCSGHAWACQMYVDMHNICELLPPKLGPAPQQNIPVA